MQKTTDDDFTGALQRASDADTPTAELTRLAQSRNSAILGALALNAATPQEVLNKLAALGNNEVNVALGKRGMTRVHPTAIISPRARLGSNVVVGPYTIIHDNVVIGDGTVIESHCVMGYATPATASEPLLIGDSSLIRSHSVFYEGSTFGARLVTGHRVTVREHTRAGSHFQIGTLGDIQGHCQIGDYVRFHSNVHVGQHSEIGSYVWIFPYVVLTNDPHPPSDTLMGVVIEDFAAIATMSIILPGVRVKKGALVGAHSSVARDVEEDTVVAGSPAKFICDTSKLKLKDGSGASAYPWRRHFHRGYPEEVVAGWLKEFS